MQDQQTLVILKHDTVARGLIGEVVIRFERVGLKIVAFEFIAATEDMGDKHYATTEENLKRFGNNTLKECKEKGIDPGEKYGTADPIEIGKMIKKWNVELLTRGPVLAMILQAPDVVEVVRKLAGDTRPKSAAPGTIRGDYSWDNYEVANDELRAVYNILHASGSPEEAEYEIKLWFGNTEIIDNYELYAHRAMRKSNGNK